MCQLIVYAEDQQAGTPEATDKRPKRGDVVSVLEDTAISPLGVVHDIHPGLQVLRPGSPFRVIKLPGVPKAEMENFLLSNLADGIGPYRLTKIDLDDVAFDDLKTSLTKTTDKQTVTDRVIVKETVDPLVVG